MPQGRDSLEQGKRSPPTDRRASSQAATLGGVRFPNESRPRGETHWSKLSAPRDESRPRGETHSFLENISELLHLGFGLAKIRVIWRRIGTVILPPGIQGVIPGDIVVARPYAANYVIVVIA